MHPATPSAFVLCFMAHFFLKLHIYIYMVFFIKRFFKCCRRLGHCIMRLVGVTFDSGIISIIFDVNSIVVCMLEVAKEKFCLL